MSKILITGGSGLIGKKISELLLAQNHQPVWLSRNPVATSPIQQYKWDIEKQFIDPKAFENIDAIIHLAGEGIVEKPWTEKRKKELLESRVKTSELLFNTLSQSNTKQKAFVGCSAVGYYGAQTSSEVMTESHMAGSDFLANTCVEWENSYKRFINHGFRTSIIRVGVVLSNNGGAYQKLYKPFKFGFGSPVASGKQFFPWIHIHDLASIFVYAALNENITGVYNAVASPALTNEQFSQALANSFQRKMLLPNIPEFVLRMVLGDRVVALTEGKAVANDKIKSTGFVFKFENIEEALHDLARNAK